MTHTALKTLSSDQAGNENWERQGSVVRKLMTGIDGQEAEPLKVVS